EDLRLRSRRHRRLFGGPAGEGRGRPFRGGPRPAPRHRARGGAHGPNDGRRAAQPPRSLRPTRRPRPAGRGRGLHQGAGPPECGRGHRPAPRPGHGRRLRVQWHPLVVLRPPRRRGGRHAPARGGPGRRHPPRRRRRAHGGRGGLRRLFGDVAGRGRGFQPHHQADPGRAGRRAHPPRRRAGERLQGRRPPVQRQPGHPRRGLGQAAQQPGERPDLPADAPEHARHLRRPGGERRGAQGGGGRAGDRRRHGPARVLHGAGADLPFGADPPQAFHPPGSGTRPADGDRRPVHRAAALGAGARRADAHALAPGGAGDASGRGGGAVSAQRPGRAGRL
ncbi:MAG: 2-dehydropantoate 2-reductase, partial [uncultured Acetobacteraceae bacterium]